jgi:flagellar motility protein MotE (MotC chaperone)
MTIRPLPLAIAAMAGLIAVKVAALAGNVGWSAAPEAHASPPHEASPPAAAATTAAPAADCAPPPDAAPPISDAERAALQELRARRDQLDTREKQVGVKEAVLAAAETRIAGRVKELADLQARLQAQEDARAEHEKADWEGLVHTYEAMRPRDAAAILSGMEMPILLQVLDRMADRKAALVLAAMPPDRARTATTELAQMRLKANQPVQAEP